MKLIHFSTSYVTHVDSTPQTIDGNMKPRGLWLSVEGSGDGWSWWCRSEQYRIHCLKRKTEIILKPDANILRLETTVDILDFTEEYLQPFLKPTLSSLTMHIDWKRVADKYQGIIISPYNWHLRLDHRASWYCGWDCASGCIWDAEAIAEIISVPVRKRKSTSLTAKDKS